MLQSHFPADLLTFTEDNLNRKHFLCGASEFVSCGCDPDS